MEEKPFLSLETLLPEIARTVIYNNATHKEHYLEKKIVLEIEKRLNLALDRQIYRVTQTKAASTFVGNIPRRVWGNRPTDLFFWLSFGPRNDNSVKTQKSLLNEIEKFFMFIVGWLDEDNVELLKKRQNLCFNIMNNLMGSEEGTDARKRAEIKLQWVMEDLGRWLEKIMY
jgi:hypothetical protein